MLGEYLSGLAGGKLWTWMFAALGSAVGVAAAPAMTRSQQLLTYLSGLLCGGILAPIACWKLGIPEDFTGAVGFMIGIPGMQIVRFIIIVSSDPWAAWARFKGRKNV